MGKIYPHPQWKDTGDSKETIDDEPALVTKLEVGDTSTHITKDGDGNMTFDDAVTGSKTLAELSAGGGGGVDTSGTPVDNDFAKFTDADTIEGRSYTEVKQDLSLEDSDINTLITATKLDDLTAPDDTADLDATDALHGLMPKADKGKLDGIATGADVTGSNAPQAHASTHDSGGSDQIHSIADDDDDTKIQVEESADEDIIRMDVAGTERVSLGDAGANITTDHWLFGSSVGIIGIPKQSGAGAYRNTADIKIKDATNTTIPFNAELFDHQNEMTIVTESTATANTTGTDLYDTSNPFVEGDVGKRVWNYTDGGSTTIATYVRAGHVTLTADIDLDSTDKYGFGFARFTATEDGTYVISAQSTFSGLSDGKRIIVYIKKNGTHIASGQEITGAASCAGGVTLSTCQMLANDYIEIETYHNEGSADDLRNGAQWTYVQIAKSA